MSTLVSKQEYIEELAINLINMSMTDFFKYIHTNYYPNQDISFMEYFLELTNYEGQFHVHHSKLVEYGIMTSTESGNVKKKLDVLNLKENIDFILLVDVYEQDKRHGGSNKKNYMLTPYAFKLALMRAQKRANQNIDPIIYANYYLLLEQVYRLYTDYEKLYKDKLLSIKDGIIGEQSNKIDKLMISNDKLIVSNGKMQNTLDILVNENKTLLTLGKSQYTDIQQLLKYGKDMNDKLDYMFSFITEFAKLTLPMWTGPTVFKNQFDNLIKNQTLAYALNHLKVLYVVGFHMSYNDDYDSDDEENEEFSNTYTSIAGNEITAKTHIELYFNCTAFQNIAATIKKLHTRLELFLLF
jgi:hypothetical protein